MTKIMKGEPVYQRKKRAKETRPREQPERKFRNDLIKYLKSRMCKVRRVEPSVRGEFDLGDLYVVNRKTKWIGWVETKSLVGTLSDGQKEFMEDCRICGEKYLVAKILEDVSEIFS